MVMNVFIVSVIATYNCERVLNIFICCMLGCIVLDGHVLHDPASPFPSLYW